VGDGNSAGRIRSLAINQLLPAKNKMAEQAKATSATTPDVIQRAKGFWAKYSKIILIAGGSIILLGGAYLGYKYWYKIPRENAANEKIFPAEKLFDEMASNGTFNVDSINIVINGSPAGAPNKIVGMLSIINEYGGTKAGNRANYITGACYLQKKDFDKAIKYLKEFDGNGANQVQSAAYRMLGMAYSEKKNTDEALNYYKKAASVLNDKDVWQKAYNLYMAADYAYNVGKTKEAIDILQDLKANYTAGMIQLDPQNDPVPAVTVDDVDKYLARLGVTK